MFQYEVNHGDSPFEVTPLLFALERNIKKFTGATEGESLATNLENVI